LPIGPQKHEEGDFYIIEVPNKKYSGHALGVQFVNGIARTKYTNKAMAFDEQFGYLVWIPEGREPWVLRKTPGPITQPDWIEEDSPLAKSDLEDEEDFLIGESAPLPEEPAQKESAPARRRVPTA
jgi:hypothetical protein